MQSIGAVVLTGGSAVRLGGVDKASIELGGKTLLERALAALVEVPDVVVVGPEVPTTRPVTFRREDPPGGGPAAGLLAGLTGFPQRPELVLAVAVDLPRLTPDTIRRLVQAAADATDGAVLIDGEGRRQHLCAAYRTSSLLTAAQSLDPNGLSMRRLVALLVVAAVPALGEEARDVDTWADLRDLADE